MQDELARINEFVGEQSHEEDEIIQESAQVLLSSDRVVVSPSRAETKKDSAEAETDLSDESSPTSKVPAIATPSVGVAKFRLWLTKAKVQSQTHLVCQSKSPIPGPTTKTKASLKEHRTVRTKKLPKGLVGSRKQKHC